MWVTIHVYIHGNVSGKPMHSYLKLRKMAFLLKNGDQDGRIGPVGGVGTS
jgi:hypothetical protein